MHVRLSTCIGAQVMDRNAGECIGSLSGIVLHPDTGKVEGVMVCVPIGMISSRHLFCGYEDIAHWGATIHVRDHDALAPMEDRIRLAPVYSEGRTIVDQRIVTKAGRSLGVCRDIQIDTEKMRLEWLFPRKWFRWGVALPATDIIAVRPDAIIVRDHLLPEAVSSEESSPIQFEAFPEIVEARS